MKCPKCSHSKTKTKETRSIANGLRRRRQCLSCKHAFTTYESTKCQDISRVESAINHSIKQIEDVLVDWEILREDFGFTYE